MKETNPPFLATWLLCRLPPRDRNEALAGDLLEQFRNGRSTTWYWRQVLAAGASTLRTQLRMRWLAIAFAFVWATFGWPIWFSFFLNSFAQHAAWIWRLEWPYSIILGSTAAMFSSLWSGTFAYLCVHAIATRSSLRKREMVRSLWIAPLVYVLLALPLRTLLGPMKLSIPTYVALSDAAYFVSLVAATWSIAPLSLALRRSSAL